MDIEMLLLPSLQHSCRRQPLRMEVCFRADLYQQEDAHVTQQSIAQMSEPTLTQV